MGPARKTFSDILPAEADPLSYAVSSRDREVVAMVAQAIDHGDVALAYQPVVQAGAEGRIAFFEGLIRVFDATGRIIPAADFIDVVEATEIGRRIDCTALDLGLTALHDHPDLRLSINMSARSIGYPPWLRRLKRALMSDETIGERLILEITEGSAMLVPELVISFMRDMRRQGIAFALDDFGSGLTSFRHLRDFLFDILKIDGEFIRGIADNPDNQVLTRALIGIGQQFDMFTVAECVERGEDAQWLAENGMDCLQGYYFAAPTIHPPWEHPARQTA